MFAVIERQQKVVEWRDAISTLTFKIQAYVWPVDFCVHTVSLGFVHHQNMPRYVKMNEDQEGMSYMSDLLV